MSTLSELQAARTSAGADYVSAFAALKAAYINLAALDETLNNSNTGARSRAPVPTFKRDRLQFIEAMHLLEHREFAPSIVANWDAEISTSAEQRVKDFT